MTQSTARSQASSSTAVAATRQRHDSSSSSNQTPRSLAERHDDHRRRHRNDGSDPWDHETPAPRARLEDDDDKNKLTVTRVHGENDNDGDDDDEEFDRDFYLNQDDEGNFLLDHTGDDNNLGRFLFTNSKIQARQADMERQQQQQQHPQGAGYIKRSQQHSSMQDDQDKWETNRLHSAGAMIMAGNRSHTLDELEETDTRVTLLVHVIQPPFFQTASKVGFGGRNDTATGVPTVKDASSDFAKMARQGSETLRRLRMEKDKHAMRQRFWELGGTRMGQAVGAAANKDGENEQADASDEAAKEDLDYKESNSYASHMRNQKQQKASIFSKSKTMQQQREFLPVYSVRDELLNVIRENNVVVIVGETGSGKVCMLPVDSEWKTSHLTPRILTKLLFLLCLDDPTDAIPYGGRLL